jgi:heme/copper-type cytochrome/quinol oxidase subunit 4
MDGLYNPVTILPSWQMYLLLEAVTVAVEFLFFFIMFMDKEERIRKWSIGEVFITVFIANIISAVVGLMIIYLSWM